MSQEAVSCQVKPSSAQRAMDIIAGLKVGAGREDKRLFRELEKFVERISEAQSQRDQEKAAKILRSLVDRNQWWEARHGDAIYRVRKEIQEDISAEALYQVKTAEG